MPDIAVMKQGNALIPVDSDTSEYLEKLKHGQVIHADFKKMRNYLFFKKFWALVNFAYDHWEPEDVYYKGQLIGKSKKRFRKDLIVLAGFHEATFDINGGVHFEAQSISFAKMTEEEFEELYSKVIDVVLRKILKTYTREQLDEVVYQLMGFV